MVMPAEQAPQGAPQGEGENAVKEMAAVMMKQAEGIMQGAELMAQMGNQQGAEMLQQAAQLIQKAMEQGGAVQQQPMAEGQPTETAGVANARPADLRG